MTSAQTVHPAAGESATRRLVVSFSGLDGAGKTRQINALEDHFAAAGRTCEVLWIPFKIWPEQLINRLPAAWRSRLGPKRRAVAADGAPAAPPAAPGARRRTVMQLTRAVWTCVAVVASVSAGLSLRRRLAQSHASVVILDRYRLDSIVKLQFWYADVPPGLVAWLVRRLTPAPDVELLLAVHPDVAYARKPEQWTPAQLARQARLYDVLAVTGDVVVLDGTDAPERLAAEIRRRVVGLDDHS